MKKSIFAAGALAALLCFGSGRARADQYSINIGGHSMVTLNNAVRCPASDKGRCVITVTIDRIGRISVEVSGISVSNPGLDGTAQDIAEHLAAVLESGGEIRIEE